MLLYRILLLTLKVRNITKAPVRVGNYTHATALGLTTHASSAGSCFDPYTTVFSAAAPLLLQLRLVRSYRCSRCTCCSGCTPAAPASPEARAASPTCSSCALLAASAADAPPRTVASLSTSTGGATPPPQPRRPPLPYSTLRKYAICHDKTSTIFRPRWAWRDEHTGQLIT
jgi:hypothetical protein